MDVCAILLGIGLTMLCPARPDPAAEELRVMQEEMQRQERQADEKIERLRRGLGDCPECVNQRIDPRTMTRAKTP
jgi:hypothetical protein